MTSTAQRQAALELVTGLLGRPLDLDQVAGALNTAATEVGDTKLLDQLADEDYGFLTAINAGQTVIGELVSLLQDTARDWANRPGQSQ